MLSKPCHRIFGTPLDEWISLIPNELEKDDIGLWQFIPTYMKDFGLTGKALDDAVRLTIKGLLLRGAVPIVSPYLSREKEIRHDLYGEGEDGVSLIFEHWKSLDHEPNFEDIWLSLPNKI